ncbi:MAG: UDP-N-acetylmuramate dehydrogenase [Bdellovibrionales bacterium]|nr:UDP-N-acetylmuramate dehydrogenase [Bdellovibrionales bacterium]
MLSELEQKGLIQRDHLLADYSSWKVGGLADFFSAPKSLEELKEVLHCAQNEKWPVTIFSGGSNVLFSDQGIRGLAIGMSSLNGTEAREENGRLHLVSWAGSSKGELLKHFLKYELDPALFLAGLPGDVGGGVVMNAGVGGHQRPPREFCEIVDWVEVLRWEKSLKDFEIHRLTSDQLSWSYRHCLGWQPGVMTRVGVSWPLEPNPQIKQEVRDLMRRRLQTQPLDRPNCGSVFRNPEGDKAGRLIEACELKGFQFGDAQVSPKHANFIVNLGKAQAQDIRAVIEFVQKKVKAEKGVSLQTEVVYLGEWESPKESI